MSLLEITTNVGCPVTCDYCPQDVIISTYFRAGGPEQMSMEMFQDCLDSIPRDVHILFSGMSEPWANPECSALVRYARYVWHPVSVYTTTYGMTISDVRLLAHIPFRRFVLHRVPGASDDVVSLCRSTLSHYSEENMTWDKAHSRAGNLLGKKKIRRKGRITCASSGDRLDHNVLMPDGRVFLCCMDYRMEHALGNLRSETWEAIMKGTAITRLRKGLKDESIPLLCRHCENSKEIK